MCAGAGAVCKFEYFKFIKTSQKYNLLYCLCVYVCLYCRLPVFVDALRIIYLYMRTKPCVHRRIVFSVSAAVEPWALFWAQTFSGHVTYILLSFQYFYIQYIYIEDMMRCVVWLRRKTFTNVSYTIMHVCACAGPLESIRYKHSTGKHKSLSGCGYHNKRWGDST